MTSYFPREFYSRHYPPMFPYDAVTSTEAWNALEAKKEEKKRLKAEKKSTEEEKLWGLIVVGRMKLKSFSHSFAVSTNLLRTHLHFSGTYLKNGPIVVEKAWRLLRTTYILRPFSVVNRTCSFEGDFPDRKVNRKKIPFDLYCFNVDFRIIINVNFCSHDEPEFQKSEKRSHKKALLTAFITSEQPYKFFLPMTQLIFFHQSQRIKH